VHFWTNRAATPTFALGCSALARSAAASEPDTDCREILNKRRCREVPPFYPARVHAAGGGTGGATRAGQLAKRAALDEDVSMLLLQTDGWCRFLAGLAGESAEEEMSSVLL
jgi:hypothetical protein